MLYEDVDWKLVTQNTGIWPGLVQVAVNLLVVKTLGKLLVSRATINFL
jgi:hypothetical protein